LAKDGEKAQWTSQRIKQPKELSKDTDIYKKLMDSLAPFIWELENVKKGILCMLFGGNQWLVKRRHP
jgi:DNA replication licensing factor MCM4